MKLYIIIGMIVLLLAAGCKSNGNQVNQRFDMDSENQRVISNQAERQTISYDYGEGIRDDDQRLDPDKLTIEREKKDPRTVLNPVTLTKE